MGCIVAIHMLDDDAASHEDALRRFREPRATLRRMKVTIRYCNS